MIRYRCPHCAAVIIAHERRAGQSSVCKACVKPHPIPADPALWLTETGDPLRPPAVEPVVAAHVPAAPEVLVPTVFDLQLPEPAAPEPPAPVTVVAREPEPEPAKPAPRVTRPAPMPAPRTAGAPAPSDDATVATATPPPRPRPLPVPAPTPAPRAGRFNPAPVPVPPVVPRPADRDYGDPVQLQTQADIAVALTAALTSRMKPPPAPRRDLRPSTAAWMLLTGLGVALIALAAFSDPGYRWPALAVAAVQVACGYAWIVRLTHLRDPKRGLACAVPPLTFYYLGQYKYAKFRPLRFVATGAVLAGLAAVAPTLHAHTRALVGKTDPAPVVPADVGEQSMLEQLRTYRERQAYDALGRVLEVLAKTDPLLSKEAKDRPELTAELKALCEHSDSRVKVLAMAAYARWDPVGAQAVCLAAVRSPTEDERKMALHLLPQWKDAESARAVQSLIGRAGTVETNKAKAALEEIGGAPAEQAAIALFNRADDQATKLTALSILEKVGGAGVVDWLQSRRRRPTTRRCGPAPWRRWRRSAPASRPPLRPRDRRRRNFPLPVRGRALSCGSPSANPAAGRRVGSTRGAIAQLVERFVRNEEVGSSTLLRSTP